MTRIKRETTGSGLCGLKNQQDGVAGLEDEGQGAEAGMRYALVMKQEKRRRETDFPFASFAVCICGLCVKSGRATKKPLGRGLGQSFAIYETYIKQVLH
jgi:hypothetical protein